MKKIKAVQDDEVKELLAKERDEKLVAVTEEYKENLPMIFLPHYRNYQNKSFVSKKKIL